MTLLGITGGIGSGKSYVCRRFEALGCPVYDTDQAARRLMLTDAALQQALARLIGQPVVGCDGALCKPAISAFIRQGEANKQRLDALVHPCVRADMLRWADRQRALPDAPGVAVVECALLFESGFADDMDCVAVVTAPEDVRVERVMARDGKPRAEVLRWMSLQMPESEKIRRARHLIHNDNHADLDSQIRELLRELSHLSDLREL